MHKILDDIAFNKTGESLNRSDFSSEYNNYLIQRFLTMYSNLNVEILNLTVNILWKTLSDEENYMLMETIIPPVSYENRGEYIKVKKKESKDEEKDDSILQSSAVFEESAKKLNESLVYVYGDI